MSIQADCYVLVEKRSKEVILNFLNFFLPYRKESADEYEIPQYADRPEQVLESATELIDYMVTNSKEIHSIYWHTIEEGLPIKGAMCFFIEDGHMILGINCITYFPDTTLEDKHFQQLKEFANTDIGYVTYEEPPLGSKNEILKRINKMN